MASRKNKTDDVTPVDDPMAYESPDAEAVREGKLSAAQLPEGSGNVDPSNPDAQYPPGVVQNKGVRPSASDLRSMVPADDLLTTTDANPDYS